MNGVTLGKNIASLSAIRRLDSVTSDLSSTLSRLSSGQRINSPSDDAAGLAVADTLRNDARLYGAASRNVNDAISALNIMDGTLTSQTSILHRLGELAEQSSNGSYSKTQRAALDTEYQKLVEEFGRLGDTTRFNNINLLLGSRGTSSLVIQAGITGSTLSTLRANTIDSGSNSGIIDARNLPDYPISGGESITTDELGEITDGRYWHFSVIDENGRSRDMLLTFFDGAGATFYQRASDVGGVGAGTDSGASVDDANDDWIMASFTGSFWNSTTGQLDPITWSFTFDNTSVQSANNLIDLPGIYFNDGSTTATGAENAISFTGVDSVDRSLAALTVVRNRLDTISLARGNIGAVMSRLKTSIDLLGVSKENVARAESRIRDVDVASEAGELTRKTILQKTASSVLAQANLQPQIALSLLNFEG